MENHHNETREISAINTEKTMKLERNALKHSDHKPESLRDFNNLHSNQLKPETVQQLKAEAQHTPALKNGDAIMKDNTGHAAEKYAQVVIKSEGLPDGYGRKHFNDVIEVKIDHNNHGIDLIGVEKTGQPNMIEVKKRAGIGDGLGSPRIEASGLEPETHALMDEIKAERARNPLEQERVASRLQQAKEQWPNSPEKWGDYDEELSTLQMGGAWSRDRWFKMIKNSESRAQLQAAGVDSKYLGNYAKNGSFEPGQLSNPHSAEWQDIMDRRKIIIVGHERDQASMALARDAMFRRKANVIGMTVSDLN